MRPFLVCMHDASPAWERETRTMLRDLAPLTGRRLSFGVVPDWHGTWPLAAHPDYCRLLQEASEELLLHGYFHRRRRGSGIITLLTRRSDEMNGLDEEATVRTLERGQRAFAEVFGERARGFLAPGWQRGHVHRAVTAYGGGTAQRTGLEHVLGFFSLDSCDGRSVPLATWTWDCGRLPWLGHVGHAIGRSLHALDRRVPVLAIHPLDLVRGYWPKILRLIGDLLERGYVPDTAAGLLAAPASLASTPIASAPIPSDPIASAPISRAGREGAEPDVPDARC